MHDSTQNLQKSFFEPRQNGSITCNLQSFCAHSGRPIDPFQASVYLTFWTCQRWPETLGVSQVYPFCVRLLLILPSVIQCIRNGSSKKYARRQCRLLRAIAAPSRGMKANLHKRTRGGARKPVYQQLFDVRVVRLGDVLIEVRYEEQVF